MKLVFVATDDMTRDRKMLSRDVSIKGELGSVSSDIGGMHEVISSRVEDAGHYRLC